jgi:serine/threonine protein kinase
MITKLLEDVLKALSCCNKKGIAHLDVKPDNILVHGDGSFKLGEFGNAKIVDREGEICLDLKGQQGYMSPEMADANLLTTSSDVWGLGVVLYLTCTIKQRKFRQKPYDKEINFTDEFTPG